MISRYFLVLAFCVPLGVCAQAHISEVLYDPPTSWGHERGREWIEVENTGTKELDISHWKLGNAKKSFATLSKHNIKTGECVVIASNAQLFKQHFGVAAYAEGYFTIANKQAQLVLVDAEGALVDSATIKSGFGAKGNGKSLHRIDDEYWKEGEPTPFDCVFNTPTSTHSLAAHLTQLPESSSKTDTILLYAVASGIALLVAGLILKESRSAYTIYEDVA